VAAHVELSVVAERDLKRLGPGPDRKVIIDALAVGLTAVPPPGNLDIKALRGAAPWLRLRVGDYRILYRPLTREELKAVSRQRKRRAEAGYLVARIVHRRDLDRAVRALPM
jgi:mRNA-degrading endonuclease RelE of RelBE toxin-antitoxin system